METKFRVEYENSVWCIVDYPGHGARVPLLGFFDKEDALQEAARLNAWWASGDMFNLHWRPE